MFINTSPLKKESWEVKGICYYITATLPKKVKMENIRPVLYKYWMDFLPQDCPEELLEKRSNNVCFRPIEHHCYCDTTLEILNRRGGVLTKKDLKRLKKNPEMNEERIARIAEQRMQELENAAETVQWFEFLREFLRCGEVFHIGLFIHWASDSLVINETKRFKKEDITKELLLNMEQDVLYEFMMEVQY